MEWKFMRMPTNTEDLRRFVLGVMDEYLTYITENEYKVFSDYPTALKLSKLSRYEFRKLVDDKIIRTFKFWDRVCYVTYDCIKIGAVLNDRIG